MKGYATLVVLALTTSAAPAQSPQSQPKFPSEAELVAVDAVVIDRDGEPVRDLRVEDFTVFEDGKPQKIVTFEAVHRTSPTRADGAAPPAAVSFNLDPVRRSARSFVLVFDDVHLGIAEAKRARDAVTRLLANGVADGDGVSLVATGGESWWTARMPAGRDDLISVLGRLPGRRQEELSAERMSDYEAMRIYKDQDPLVTDRVARRLVANRAIFTPTGGTPGSDLDDQRYLARSLAARNYERNASRDAATLDVIARSIASLATVRGRKSLVLVSGGFVHDPYLNGFKRVVGEARRANVAVYFVDARGLAGPGAEMTAEASAPTDASDFGSLLAQLREASEGSESLAADTGGFSVRNTNDLAAGIRRIAQESTSYYLLGYAPSTPPDDHFRRIGVTVNRPSLTVRARRGYYSLSMRAAGSEKRDPAIQQALDSPFDLLGLPLSATAHVFGEIEPGKASVLLTAEVDIAGMKFEEHDGLAMDTLEFLLVVASRATGEYNRYDNQFVMRLKPETRSRLAQNGYSITRPFKLAPDSYQARIVARDANGGQIGSLSHDFVVPPLGAFRLSTPVLSDRLSDDPASGPEIVARRAFVPHGMLHCRFEVYDAAPDPSTGQPRVNAGFAIRRADGRFLVAAHATPIVATAGGTLTRTVGAPLDQAPPGSYELIVVAQDMVTGQTVESREAFVIVAPR